MHDASQSQTTQSNHSIGGFIQKKRSANVHACALCLSIYIGTGVFELLRRRATAGTGMYGIKWLRLMGIIRRVWPTANASLIQHKKPARHCLARSQQRALLMRRRRCRLTRGASLGMQTECHTTPSLLRLILCVCVGGSNAQSRCASACV